MKRIIILLVFVCFAKINFAQLYQPFPTDSAIWRQVSAQWLYPDMDVQDYVYYLQGDTLISGNTYHQVYKTELNSNYSAFGTGIYAFVSGPFMIDSNKYVGAIREDGLKHIHFVPDSAVFSEVLLYDFNLNVGDTLPVTYNNEYYGQNYVSSIDSILLGVTYHKRYNLGFWSGLFGYTSIIEGVGSAFGLLEQIVNPLEHYDYLTCFTHRGTIIYTDSSSVGCNLPTPVGINEHSKEAPISIFPNPTTGIINIKTPFSEKTSIEILDVLGKTIYQTDFSSSESFINLRQFPKGVYFLKASSGNQISTTQKIILQ